MIEKDFREWLEKDTLPRITENIDKGNAVGAAGVTVVAALIILAEIASSLKKLTGEG